jgi:Penicillin-insensitive murein endopeptidase
MSYRLDETEAQGYLPSERELQEAFDRGELPSLRAWLGLGSGPPPVPAAHPAAPTVTAPPRAPAPIPTVLPQPAVNTQLPAAGPGFYARSLLARRFGQPDTIRALQAIGAAWQRAHPSGPRIGIGDISFHGGGPMPPHKSHQNGLDVDIRPVRNDGQEQAVRHDLPSYSRSLTQELVDRVRANGVLAVQYIFFNDPAIRGVRPWPGHDDHLHVRFSPGPIPPGPAPAQAPPAVRRTANGSRTPAPPVAAAIPAPPAPITPPRPIAAPTPTAGPPTAVRLGVLVARGPEGIRFRYAFTPEDLLWTARFIVGEAGGQRDDPDNRAVIWAMLNRYALLTNKYYPTFHQFLRSYSTPLQPVLRSWRAARRHMANPDFVRTGRSYPPPAPPDIPMGQLRNFLLLQDTPWPRLPAPARTLAETALAGRLPNLIGNATEFDNTRVYFRDQHGRLPSDAEWRQYTEAFAKSRGLIWIGLRPDLDQRRNAFFIKQRLANLPRDAVQVQPGR